MTVHLFSSLNNIVYADVEKEYSGNWSVNLRLIKETAPTIVRGDTLNIDGQLFNINKPEQIKEENKVFVDFEAVHVAFELEEKLVAPGKISEIPGPGWRDEYHFTGNVIEHIEKLLDFDDEDVFTVISGGNISYPLDTTTEKSIFIGRGSILDGLNKILKYFYCRAEFNNRQIIVHPDNYKIPTSFSCEYALNNLSIKREINEEDRITKLIAKATLFDFFDEDDTGDVVYKSYGSGYKEAFVDFGEVGKGTPLTANLDSLANEYLDFYNNPLPRYVIEVSELKNIINTPEGEDYSDWEFDVAQEIQVKDNDLGIEKNLIVKKYEYSLVEKDKPSKLHLGTIQRDIMREINKPREQSVVIWDRINVERYIEVFMDYINKRIFGGDIRDINPELLNITATTEIEGETRKTLNGAITAIENIMSDTVVSNTNNFEIYNIYEQLEGRIFLSLMGVTSMIRRYIRSTVESGIVDAVNNAYQNVIGEVGTVDLIEPWDDISIFEDEFNLSERQQGARIFNLIDSLIGNPTGIYTEIGGGRNGIIPAINNLYNKIQSVSLTQVEKEGEELVETRKKYNPRIFTSKEEPDDGKGTDGDIWFQFEEEEGE